MTSTQGLLRGEVSEQELDDRKLLSNFLEDNLSYRLRKGSPSETQRCPGILFQATKLPRQAAISHDYYKVPSRWD
jgi:hypothetical protein